MLARVSEQFTTEGFLGVLIVDASSLAEIEKSFGDAAHRNAQNQLGQLISELLEEQLAIADMIVSGETGRDEFAVFLFRDTGEAEFYHLKLPALTRVLTDGLAKRGGRIGYPHMRSAPALHVGAGAALRNKGVQALLDASCDFLPSPLDLPPAHGHRTAARRPAARDPSRAWGSAADDRRATSRTARD